VFKPLDDFIQQQAWLDSAGGPLQAWINDTFSRAGGTGKTVKNLLNGTWLGHPLHPVLTDVPIGAWICTFVLDTAAGMSDSREIRTAADITLATGLAASIGAAGTGWTDWSDTYGKDRRVGLLHGLTMAAAVVTYAVALIARVAGARRAGVILSNTGLAVASALRRTFMPVSCTTDWRACGPRRRLACMQTGMPRSWPRPGLSWALRVVRSLSRFGHISLRWSPKSASNLRVCRPSRSSLSHRFKTGQAT